jgi:DNA-3-methyladenine glycosylase
MARRKRLTRSFYGRPTLDVARDLLGKHVVYLSADGRLSAKIVEVEAYIGQGDPACHAARGRTGRNAVMFGKPGFSYIYFVYGMYHCLNFVTEREGFPAAVLLRAAEPVDGLALMQRNSPGQGGERILSGPGKYCRAFGLTTEQSGLDLTARALCIEDHGESVAHVTATNRVGIRTGTELAWRFYDADSTAVSRRSKTT